MKLRALIKALNGQGVTMRILKVFLIKKSSKVKIKIEGKSRRELRAEATGVAEKLNMAVGSMSFL